MSLRILVGLDASPRSLDVLKAAAGMAKRTGGKLLLLRTVGVPHEIPPEAYVLPPHQLSEMLVRESKQSIDEIAKSVPAELLEKTRVEIGTAWQTVCSVATEENVDLIMVGSHGYSGLDRLVGTTAAKIVNHADRSVLVVRMSELLAH